MPKKLLSDMSDEEIRKDLKKKAREVDVQNAWRVHGETQRITQTSRDASLWKKQ